MTVAELIEKLREMPQDADVELQASFDGMCGQGLLAEVMVEDGLVVLRDQEMSGIA